MIIKWINMRDNINKFEDEGTKKNEANIWYI